MRKTVSRHSRIRNVGLVAALLLTGCAAAGRDFDITRVHALNPGKTSVAEAEQLFGKPLSISAEPDGGKLLRWWYVTSTLDSQHRTSLSVLFGPDDRMVRMVRES